MLVIGARAALPPSLDRLLYRVVPKVKECPELYRATLALREAGTPINAFIVIAAANCSKIVAY